MLTFISCAKTMTNSSKVATPYATTPRYLDEAQRNALAMSQFTTNELMSLLRVNSKIAAENHLRYLRFAMDQQETLAALLAYTGVVFKHINPEDFTMDDFRYAQDHLRITSFMYGLLRPLDRIDNYRMEGDLRLSIHDNRTMFESWREVLTRDFIEDIKAQGGVLMNLASGEMKGLFDWRLIEKEVQVVTPEFKVWKSGKLSTVVVYAKMCRGEMTRYILKNRIEDPTLLHDFEWEGFRFDPTRSDDRHYLFTME